MRSIGSRYQGPQYNHTDMCDICGAFWNRTDMVLDADGLLRCPEDRDGYALIDLATIAAQAVNEIQPLKGKTRDVP
jgi:hypothetical protein